MESLAAARASSAAAAARPLPFASNVAHPIPSESFFAKPKPTVVAFNSRAGGLGAKRGPELLDAIKSGNETKAVELIRIPGVPLEYRGVWILTPLMLASNLGYVEVVRALLEQGADKNAVAGFGLSPDPKSNQMVIEFPAYMYTSWHKYMRNPGLSDRPDGKPGIISVKEINDILDKYNAIIHLIVGNPAEFIQGKSDRIIKKILSALEDHPIAVSIKTIAMARGYKNPFERQGAATAAATAAATEGPDPREEFYKWLLKNKGKRYENWVEAKNVTPAAAAAAATPPSGGRRRYRSLHKTKKNKKHRVRRATASRNRKY